MVISSGCNKDIKRAKKGARKFQKLITTFPDLVAEKRDTIVSIDTVSVISKIPVLDTMIITNRDTITVEKDRIKTVVEIQRKEIPVYRIITKVENDTFEIISRDTLIQIQKEIVTQIKTVKKVPWWVIAVCLSCVVALVFVVVKSG